MEISVVVPAFNSERSLPILVHELEAVLSGDNFEVILVNDGSSDGTAEVIRFLSEQFPFVRGVQLMRNYGQHNAVLCGIRQARFDVIITIDDDLQNPPREIPRLLSKLDEGFDVVYGAPRERSHGFMRDAASSITKLALQSAMGVDIARKVSAFRVFRTIVREAFRDYEGPSVSIDVLLTWGTTRFAAVPVDNPPRSIGVSNYTVGKLLRHAMNMITGFSTLPLQAASLLGFALTLFGAGVFFYVIGRYFIQGSSVPGFPLLASIISIFSGAQLFALGIIGEYLARMHFRTMRRPTYVIRAMDGD